MIVPFTPGSRKPVCATRQVHARTTKGHPNRFSPRPSRSASLGRQPIRLSKDLISKKRPIHSDHIDFEILDNRQKDKPVLNLWDRIQDDPLSFVMNLDWSLTQLFNSKNQASLTLDRWPEGFEKVRTPVAEIPVSSVREYLFRDKVDQLKDTVHWLKVIATTGEYAGCELGFFFSITENLKVELVGFQISGESSVTGSSWMEEFRFDRDRMIRDPNTYDGKFAKNTFLLQREEESLYFYVTHQGDLRVFEDYETDTIEEQSLNQSPRKLGPSLGRTEITAERILKHPSAPGQYLLFVEGGFLPLKVHDREVVLHTNEVQDFKRIKKSKKIEWPIDSLDINLVIDNTRDGVQVLQEGLDLANQKLRQVKTDSGFILRFEEEGCDVYFEVCLIPAENGAFDTFVTRKDCPDFYTLWFQQYDLKTIQRHLGSDLTSHPYEKNKYLWRYQDSFLIEVHFSESGQFLSWQGEGVLLNGKSDISIEVDGCSDPIQIEWDSGSFFITQGDTLFSVDDHNLFELTDDGVLIASEGQVLLVKRVRTNRGYRILVCEAKVDHYVDHMISRPNDNEPLIEVVEPAKNVMQEIVSTRLDSEDYTIEFSVEFMEQQVELTLSSDYRFKDLNNGMGFYPTFTQSQIWGTAHIDGQEFPIQHIHAQSFLVGPYLLKVEEMALDGREAFALISIQLAQAGEKGRTLSKDKIKVSKKVIKKPVDRPVKKKKPKRRKDVDPAVLRSKVEGLVKSEDYISAARLGDNSRQTIAGNMERNRVALLASQIFLMPSVFSVHSESTRYDFKGNFVRDKGRIELKTGPVHFFVKTEGGEAIFKAELIRNTSDPEGIYRYRYRDAYYAVYCEHGNIYMYDQTMSAQGFHVDPIWYREVVSRSIQEATKFSFEISGVTIAENGQITWQPPEFEVPPQYMFRDFTQWLNVAKGFRVGVEYSSQLTATEGNPDFPHESSAQLWRPTQIILEDQKHNRDVRFSLGTNVRLVTRHDNEKPTVIKVNKPDGSLPSSPALVLVSGFVYFVPQSLIPTRYAQINKALHVLSKDEDDPILSFVEEAYRLIANDTDTHIHGGPDVNEKHLRDVITTKELSGLDSVRMISEGMDLPNDGTPFAYIQPGYYLAADGWRLGAGALINALPNILGKIEKEDDDAETWDDLVDKYFGDQLIEQYPGQHGDRTDIELQALEKLLRGKGSALTLEESSVFAQGAKRLKNIHDPNHTVTQVKEKAVVLRSHSDSGVFQMSLPIKQQSAKKKYEFDFGRSGTMTVKLDLNSQVLESKVALSQWEQLREFEVITFKDLGFKFVLNRKTGSTQILPLYYDPKGVPWIYESIKLNDLKLHHNNKD